MSLKSTILADTKDVFLNTDDFGEVVTLVRNGVSYSVQGLYDELPIPEEDMGGGVDAISHNPRLFVSVADLPGGSPVKGDSFVLSQNEFHGSKKLVAKKFESPKDGMVVYYLKEKK